MSTPCIMEFYNRKCHSSELTMNDFIRVCNSPFLIREYHNVDPSLYRLAFKHDKSVLPFIAKYLSSDDLTNILNLYPGLIYSIPKNIVTNDMENVTKWYTDILSPTKTNKTKCQQHGF